MKKRSILIPIVLLVIGFAVVSTTLVINGNIEVQTNKDAFVDGLVFDEASLRTSNDNISAEISPSGRTLSFTTQTMTSVDETATVYFNIKNYSQYDATLGTPAISCYFVSNHQVDTKAEAIADSPYMKLIEGHELDGDTILAGGNLSEETSVTVKQIKSSIDNNQEVKFQCEINATGGDSATPAIERPGNGTYELVVDTDNSGTITVGDEIRVGTESFYVLSNTDTEINALAKFNLNVGDNANPAAPVQGIQLEENNPSYGTMAFSNNRNWTPGSDINIKSETDGTLRDALYGTNGYEKYLKQTIRSVSVRLLTKLDIERILGVAITNDGAYGIIDLADDAGYSWLCSTSYWVGTSSYHPTVDDNTSYVYLVDEAGNLFYDSYNTTNLNYGVRPVITIPLS